MPRVRSFLHSVCWRGGGTLAAYSLAKALCTLHRCRPTKKARIKCEIYSSENKDRELKQNDYFPRIHLPIMMYPTAE